MAEKARYTEQKAHGLKIDAKLTDRQISARLKKSMYWVKKTLGHPLGRKVKGTRRTQRQVPFGKITMTTRAKIAECISNFTTPIRIPELSMRLLTNYQVRISMS